MLEAAREAFAARGFDASYHEIARLASVGVGTVYRRYPDRQALLEAVLLDLLDDLTARAGMVTDAAAGDVWPAFVRFFEDLSDAMQRHAGLSQRIEERGGARVSAARQRLLSALDRLCCRARLGGLRADVGRRHLLLLAQAGAIGDCGLDPGMDLADRGKTLDVILAGLRNDHTLNHGQ